MFLSAFPQRTKIQLSPHPPYDALRCHSRQPRPFNDAINGDALFRESFSLRDAFVERAIIGSLANFFHYAALANLP